MLIRNPKQKEEERKAFESFLRAYASLGSEVKWKQPNSEFPDVVVTLRDGKEIDFELGRWLDEEQIQETKKTERVQLAISQAIGIQPENSTQHIHCVMISMRNDVTRFDSNDGEIFKSQLFDLIECTDQRWPNERHWHSPQGYHCTDFACYPTLDKYLAEAWYVPRQTGNSIRESRPHGIDWICFETGAKSYSSESALQALRSIVEKKAQHYGSASDRRVYLLIYYGFDAARYNTPWVDVHHEDFESVAREASKFVKSLSSEKKLPFEKVYLLHALLPDLKAFEIYPDLTECK